MLSWRFYSSFQIQQQRWHLETFRKSNHSRLFRASLLGQMNLLHQQMYTTSRCFELREIHSVSSTMQNDIVVRNNVFPRQAPNQLKISFWKISFSLYALSTTHSFFISNFRNQSLSSLSSISIFNQWRLHRRSRSALVWKSTRRSTRNGSTSPIQVSVFFSPPPPSFNSL